MLKSRYLMIGGFLGAGKTTAILQLARRFQAAGLRVGLITNDQSVGLADTAVLDANGFATEEITGGCFCCKFNSLVEAAERLTAETRPDVLIAEPVGSCTDLQATVGFPLRKLYGERFAVAPLSVLVDPLRAQSILGLTTGKKFSSKVVYIYEKQLEEAELLIINKVDLLPANEIVALESALLARWPHLQVLKISARTGAGMDAWADRLETSAAGSEDAMDVDYDTYADGEALLGWLNLSAELSGAEFDGNAFALDLLAAIQRDLCRDDLEIAHLKLTLSPATGNDLAAANLIRSEGRPELSHRLAAPLAEGELLVNVRAEADPERIRAGVLNRLREVCDSASLGLNLRTVEAFRPGRPQPTHRLARA